MKYIKQSFLFTAWSFFLVAGVSIASSWVGPTAEPPNNNVFAPINVSSISQIKTGALSVGGFSLIDGTQGVGKFLVSDANGKASWVNAGGGGGVGGSGTVNYVSRWTNSSSLGNSQIFDDGTYVGIGTNAPTAKLHLKAGNKKNDPWAFRLEQGQIASGNVLTSDASGNAYWAAPRSVSGSSSYGFGGMYNLSTGGGCYYANVFTGGCSCPGGYTASLVSTVQVSGNNNNQQVFYCYSR